MCDKYDGSLNPFGDYNENGYYDAEDEFIFETYFGPQFEDKSIEDLSELEDWEDDFEEEDFERDDFMEDDFEDARKFEDFRELDEALQIAAALYFSNQQEKKEDESIEKSKRRNQERKAKLARKARKEKKKQTPEKEKQTLPFEVMEVRSKQKALWTAYRNLVLEVKPERKERITGWEPLLFCAYGLMIRSWNRPLNQKQKKNILLCHSTWSMSCSKERFEHILIEKAGQELPSADEAMKDILLMIRESGGKNRKRIEFLASKICDAYRDLQEGFAFWLFDSFPDDEGEAFAEKMEILIDQQMKATEMDVCGTDSKITRTFSEGQTLQKLNYEKLEEILQWCDMPENQQGFIDDKNEFAENLLELTFSFRWDEMGKNLMALSETSENFHKMIYRTRNSTAIQSIMTEAAIRLDKGEFDFMRDQLIIALDYCLQKGITDYYVQSSHYSLLVRGFLRNLRKSIPPDIAADYVMNFAVKEMKALADTFTDFCREIFLSEYYTNLLYLGGIAENYKEESVAFFSKATDQIISDLKEHNNKGYTADKQQQLVNYAFFLGWWGMEDEMELILERLRGLNFQFDWQKRRLADFKKSYSEGETERQTNS